MRWLIALALAALLVGCGQREPWRQESYVFGTRVEVLIHGVPEEQARAAATEVLREFDRLHRQFHAWQESELTRLNARLAAGQPAEVSAELAGYLRQAQALTAAGDGLFEPAIGRLIALWGFQSDTPSGELPRTAAIEALVKRRPASADLRVEEGGDEGTGGARVTSRNPLVALDFGGLLKGVALDRAAVILKGQGIQNALVNIGGNILALGRKGEVPWRVGIQHPRPERVGGLPLAALELHDGEAIGTSGDYHRYFEANGKRYFHLLDPRTGRPAWGTQAVTVLMPPGPEAGARSDAWSKPLFIAGKEWLAMARQLGVDHVLRVDADGTVEATPAMARRLTVELPDIRLVTRE